MNGVFLSILEFSNASQTATIKSLVLIDGNDLKKVLRGCKEQNAAGDKCVTCEDAFYLNNNGYCYGKVKTCSVYVGDICVSCDGPYMLNWQDNSCGSSCG